MKFKLKKTDKILVGKRTEEVYHYESEDGVHRCAFHAGTRPWTWVVLAGGNLPDNTSGRLIEKFCEHAMSNQSTAFEDRVKVLEIPL